ncbi:MAG: N-acetylmuramoyl-L-alanine amidase [Ignavibacteriae bacterium]|nr:N-acetylmuramoyl-L-alanine amidase [Ignavibacteriota bacterium]
MNNISYLPVSQLSPVLFPTGRYEESKGEIKLRNGSIKITPLSFYIVFDNGESIKAGQMNTPAIIIKNQLYVPAVSFFKSLETLGLFSVNQKNESFYFNIMSDTIQDVELTEPKLITAKSGEEIKISNEKKTVLINKVPIEFKKYFNENSDKLRKGLLAIKVLNERQQNDESNDNTDNKSKILQNLRDDKPVFKGNIKPLEKKYPPNLYVLPQNLIRKELEEGIESDSLKKNDINSLPDESLKNQLFASTSLYSMFSLPQFIKITSEIINDTLLISLTADSFIESYQAPDCSGKNLTLRIKNAVNSIGEFKELKGIQSIKAETVNDLLIYRIKTESNIISCKSERNGSKEIIYRVLTDSKKSPEISNTPIIKEEEKHLNPATKKDENETYGVNGFENEKRKWSLDVIVLDPGHGGHDPGAISINGYKEKNFTLEIAKMVRDLLKENMPGTKVIMTREDDTFIELHQRRQIANKNKGKLFVSIHLNSAASKPSASNGFETYILRPGRNDDAVRVANFENSVIKLEKKTEKYKALTEEELIIATMAQSAFVKFSELFAKILQSEVEKTTPMKNRGVNQAGFYVLVGASMPNVLFEAAFLSNKDDEEYINSEKGMDSVAKGIYNAIARYAEEYERLCK